MEISKTQAAQYHKNKLARSNRRAKRRVRKHRVGRIGELWQQEQPLHSEQEDLDGGFSQEK